MLTIQIFILYSYLIKHDDIFVAPEKDFSNYKHSYCHDTILPEIRNSFSSGSF